MGKTSVPYPPRPYGQDSCCISTLPPEPLPSRGWVFLGQDLNTCREHRSSGWHQAVETGFPSPMATDADAAEAATVVAGLWADAIGGDWGMAGSGGAGGGMEGISAIVADRMYAGAGGAGARGKREQIASG